VVRCGRGTKAVNGDVLRLYDKDRNRQVKVRGDRDRTLLAFLFCQVSEALPFGQQVLCALEGFLVSDKANRAAFFTQGILINENLVVRNESQPLGLYL